MLFRHFVLFFAGRTVDNRDLIFLSPGPQTSTEASRHPYQMVVVELGI
jgi:hypothetical protein